MSARLLTVLILPTLLLAVALAPSRAAQQPTEPAKTDNGRLVTKAYPVADLVIPVIANETAAKDDAQGCAAFTTSRIPSAFQLYSREKCTACPKAENAKTTADPLEKQLISLIQNSISPTSWIDAGGTWSVEYFPLTHALVVHATPVGQEQIMELLAALRRLQDRQVVLEVRFIQVSDESYKRLKEHFELKDCKECPMASLDGKQLFQFMEAAQADARMSVMQAPKITMFNGQKCTLRIQETRFFGTKLEMLWVGETFCPAVVNEPVQLGMEMRLNPVISADQRIVHLDMHVKNARLESEDVELVPAHFISKQDPGSKCRDGILKIYQPVDCTEKAPRLSQEELDQFKDSKAVVFTQFIQKPKIARVSFERKLNLPEGKTAVLLGWSQTSEVVDAVPVLSKLPIIGKNYQHKRQVPETVLMLVTPRVIMPQEGEEVLPAPRPVQVKAEPAPSGDAEESEGPPSVEDLVAKYHKLCAAGKKDAARKIALRALKIDPTCFDQRGGFKDHPSHLTPERVEGSIQPN